MSFEFLPDAPTVLASKQYEAAQFVQVHVKLGHFLTSPLNFTWPCVPSSEITIRMIKNAIRQRHNGAASDIRLFRDKAMKDELGADDLTLKELEYQGITGGSQVNLPVVNLYYDYEHANATSESVGSAILLA